MMYAYLLPSAHRNLRTPSGHAPSTVQSELILVWVTLQQINIAVENGHENGPCTSIMSIDVVV